MRIETLTYRLHDVAAYVNWVYFFHAWGFPPRLAAVTRLHGCDACRAAWLAGFPEEERNRAAEALQLFKDARRMLDELDEDFRVRVRFGLFACGAEGDDLVFDRGPEAGDEAEARLPLLRQQRPSETGAPCLCLSDFVRPRSLPGAPDTVGLFVGTVDAEMEHLYETAPYADDFRHMLAQTLADRLAEAGVEKMHQEVRRCHWGYAPDEDLTMDDLFLEKFQGIRPAVGYPSLPDQSVNFLLDKWLGFEAVGVRLTENGAMIPHASVSGLMLAHPQARYFGVGRIGRDQLEDYARRRGMPVDTVAKFLAANL